MTIDEFVALVIVAIILALAAAPFVEACETPTSDKELAEKYKICQGGWCLRD